MPSVTEEPPVTSASHVGDVVHDAALDEPADHHEQPDEEEERRPLHPLEGLLDVDGRDEQHHGRARERHDRRLDVQRRVEEERDDRARAGPRGCA